jgi:hypothetical protein
MREWCSCGAAIRGTKRTVYEWRTNHRHTGNEEPEPDKQGAIAQTETAGRRYYESTDGGYGGQLVPIVQARIGFTPNETSKNI